MSRFRLRATVAALALFAAAALFAVGADGPSPGPPLVALLGLLLWRFQAWRRARAGRAERAPLVARSVALLAATLILAELFLQVRGVEPPEPARPPDFDRDAVDNRVNALGLREVWDTPPPRRPGEIRIAMLGDSFTFGEAVAREEAFPARVEALATERFPDSPVRVFNLGVMDNDTAQEAARYRELHDALDVDVLVLVAYLNDFTSGNPAYTLAEIYAAGFEPNWLERSFGLAAHARAIYRNRVVRARSIAHYRSSSLRDLDGEFRTFGDEILALREFATSHGVAFRMVFFPWIFELDDYPLDEVHEGLSAFAQRHDIPLLDLLDVYRGGDADVLRVSAANEHPSPVAHAMAAEAIVEFLAADLDAR